MHASLLAQLACFSLQWQCTYALPAGVQGEPFIVSLGWGALAASFSFSLAAVVWGRSGM